MSKQGMNGEEKEMPRPKVSKKNKYYIAEERYYELLHFCKQWPIWLQAIKALDGLAKRPVDLDIFKNKHGVSDPTAKCAEAIEAYQDKLNMLYKAAENACRDFGYGPGLDMFLQEALKENVVNGKSYDTIMTLRPLPISRDEFYKIRRAFFYYLSKIRK